MSGRYLMPMLARTVLCEKGLSSLQCTSNDEFVVLMFHLECIIGCFQINTDTVLHNNKSPGLEIVYNITPVCLRLREQSPDALAKNRLSGSEGRSSHPRSSLPRTQPDKPTFSTSFVYCLSLRQTPARRSSASRCRISECDRAHIGHDDAEHRRAGAREGCGQDGSPDLRWYLLRR